MAKLNSNSYKVKVKLEEELQSPKRIPVNPNLEQLVNYNIKNEEFIIKEEPYSPEVDQNDTNLSVVSDTYNSLNRCHICCKTFKTKGNLSRHMNTHNKELKNVSDICYKRITRNKGKYVPSIPQKPYQCKICHKRFSAISGVRVHGQKQHPDFKAHECDICHKGFSTIYTLKKHIFTHVGYFCTICHAKFVYKLHLINHKRTHHTEERSTDKNVIVANNTELPFTCNICNRRFNKKNQLAAHMGMHERLMAMHNLKKQNRKRPYKCKICHKGFYQNSLLKMHIALHARSAPIIYNENRPLDNSLPLLVPVYIPIEKLYECAFCHKRFLLRTALRVHLQEHALDIKFECNICHEHVQVTNYYAHNCNLIEENE